MDIKDYIKQKNSKTTGMKEYELLGVYAFAMPKLYYGKLTDEFGNVVKDDNGNPKRSSEPTGYTYKFSELGTSNIISIVVYEKFANDFLKLGNIYKITGIGYEFKKDSKFMLLENCEVTLNE